MKEYICWSFNQLLLYFVLKFELLTHKCNFLSLSTGLSIFGLVVNKISGVSGFAKQLLGVLVNKWALAKRIS